MKISVCDLCQNTALETVNSGAAKLITSLEIEALTTTDIKKKEECEESVRLLNILLNPLSYQ